MNAPNANQKKHKERFMLTIISTLCLAFAGSCGSKKSKNRPPEKPPEEIVAPEVEESNQEEGETYEIDSKNKHQNALTVIYHCRMIPKANNSSIYSLTTTNCSYGYRTLAGESPVKIHALKKYAPDAPRYKDDALQISSFDLSYERAENYQLEALFHKPPFGSLAACPQIKIDLKYADDNGATAKRLVFNRNYESKEPTWLPEGEEHWPSIQSIVQFYQDSKNEAVDIYQICSWVPDSDDVDKDQVIEIED